MQSTAKYKNEDKISEEGNWNSAKTNNKPEAQNQSFCLHLHLVST